MTTLDAPARPVNRIQHLLEPAPAAPPKDPAELARERAAIFDVALVAAIRTLQDMLDSPDGKTRIAAANSLLNLKKASLRHKAEVFERPEEEFLPPLRTPAEIAAEQAAEGVEEEEEPPPPPAPEPQWIHGIPGMTVERSQRIEKRLGTERWMRIVNWLSKLTPAQMWEELRAVKKEAPKNPVSGIPNEPEQANRAKERTKDPRAAGPYALSNLSFVGVPASTGARDIPPEDGTPTPRAKFIVC